MKRITHYLFVAALLFTCCQLSFAEEVTDSLGLKIYFRKNSKIVELDYLNNKNLLYDFVSGVKEIMSNPMCKIQKIHIRSGASPEGRFDNNIELSQTRGFNLMSYLMYELSLPADIFDVEAVGEDWMALKDMVLDNNVPDKKEILAILDKYDSYIKGKPTTVLGGPKMELMELNGGRTWNWLLANIFPDLRSAGNYTVCQYTFVQEPAMVAQEPKTGNSHDTLVVIHKHIVEVDTAKLTGTILKMELAVPGSASVADPNHTKITPPISADSIPNGASSLPLTPDSTEEYDRKPIFALRSNLLVPLLNVGIQIPVGNRLSIGADWYYPFIHREWFEYFHQTNCFQVLAPGLDFRIYPGRKHSRGHENWQYRLSGHSLGIYGFVGKFDWERDFHGQQAKFFNVGIDYMWSARLGKKKRTRLDLSIGVGYFHSHGTDYQVFRTDGLAYRTGKKKYINWMGPNKATISWVIPIYKKVRRK